MIDDKPLLKSGVSREIWDLLATDPEQFKARVKAYFELGYPGWRVVRAEPRTRTIYLKDERMK